MILLVILCQTLVYREVTALFSLRTATLESRDAERVEGKDPWSKTLNWYFFAVTNYFLYGESIIYYFKVYSFRCCSMTFDLKPSPLLACGLRRCAIAAFRNQSSNDQFHFVYDWIHGFRDVAEERIFKATVWPILLGSHEPSPHCCFKVR